MAFEQNVPHIHTDAAEGMRDVSERRAATIANMIDEAKKRGIDDSFAYDAIAAYGAENAEADRKNMKNPDDFKEFSSMFGSDLSRELYEMERVVDTDDELEIAFHYCPYVNKWVKQGRTPEEIAHLCEITMAGDHEYAKHFPCCKFKLEGTIADGNPVCTLRFTRNPDFQK